MIHDQRKPTESGILSNVFSFVSREIGEFVVSATGAAGESHSHPSKRGRGRDGNLQREHRKEEGETDRQRRGYDETMIEQWREFSGSDGGGKKRIERTKDRKKSRRDGKRCTSPGSPSHSPSDERIYSHTHSQSQSHEPSCSRVKKTKASTSSDGRPRAKSADGHGRKKDRGHEYQHRPEDADRELTPSTSSRSPSSARNNHSQGAKVRSRLQEEMTPRPPSPRHLPQEISSSQANPLPPLNTPLTLHPISMEAPYPSLRKKPSITMPGSLFPRSDSLEPEPDQEERKWLFSDFGDTHERNPNPILHSPETGRDAREVEPGPFAYRDVAPVDEFGPSPWRTRPIASVHDALTRFNASGGEERDFSLLVVASPADHVRPTGSGTAQENTHSPLSGASRKGKGRAVVCDDDELAFILDHHHVQDKENQLDAARRETGLKSKTTDDGEREKDKERIKMLEEEVRMLKEELSCRRRSPPPSQTQTQVPIPPPPPPLPPPPAVRIPLPPHLYESGDLFASARAALRQTEASSTASSNNIKKAASSRMRQPTVNVPSEKMAAFLNEMRTVRLRKVGSVPGELNGSVSYRPTSSDCAGPSGLSRSVSTRGVEGRREVEMARRKSMGAKVPISSASTSKVGLSKPTSASASSNLVPMSIGSSNLGSISARSQTASTSKLLAASSHHKPTSITSKSTTSGIAPTSSNTTNSRISSKRKADVLGETERGAASKRRSSTQTQVQSDTSTSSSSTTHGSSSTRSNFFSGPSPANHSSLSNGTDITTPSLCSDNELGGDADARMPSTPPGPRHTAAQITHDAVEIIDVDMDELEPPQRPVTPSLPQGNIFRKRPPMSLLPVPTPRRPPGPARIKGKKCIPTPERTKRGATPKPKGILLLDEDDDEDVEEDELALPPRLQWKHGAKSTAARDADIDRMRNAKGKRRLTLDEELARARSSDRLAELDVESEELVGTGTGNARRGFLAGGGAGGAPVFMGVGYVRGAEDDSLRPPASRIPRRRG